MLTRKPLTITVMATHQRWDGLAGSRSPPMRDPDCGRAVASGRAMVTAYLWGNPQISLPRSVHYLQRFITRPKRYSQDASDGTGRAALSSLARHRLRSQNEWLLRPPARGIVVVLLPQHACAWGTLLT